MPLILNTAKAILLHLATKYAAEMLFDYLLKTLAKAAERTETEFDNELVTKVAAERQVILDIIKKA